MNWINIPVALLRSPEFIGAEPEQRATWLSLLGYCCEQENTGVIIGCSDWKCRRWQQTCGITLDEAKTDSELWEWKGSDLHIMFYPADKQKEVQAKRKAGATGGKASGIVRKRKAKGSRESHSEAVVEAQPEAVGEAQLQAQLQGKRIEEKGIGIERKGKEHMAEMLWQMCPKRGRERSSMKKVAAALKSLSPNPPDSETLVKSLILWMGSDQWSKDDGQFIPALDRWIRDRKFEIEPEPAKNSRKNRAEAEYDGNPDIETLKL